MHFFPFRGSFLFFFVGDEGGKMPNICDVCVVPKTMHTYVSIPHFSHFSPRAKKKKKNISVFLSVYNPKNSALKYSISASLYINSITQSTFLLLVYPRSMGAKKKKIPWFHLCDYSRYRRISRVVFSFPSFSSLPNNKVGKYLFS